MFEPTNLPSGLPRDVAEHIAAGHAARGGPGRARTDAAKLGYARDAAGRLVNADGKYQVAKLRPTHDAIMNFIIANPQLSLRQIAGHFQVSAGWMYTLTQTDMFQKSLSEKQDQLFQATVADVHTKTVATAAHALDRLNELLPVEHDTKCVSDVADKMLQRLGYGPRAPSTQVNIQQNAPGEVPREVIVEARGTLLAVAANRQRSTISATSEQVAYAGHAEKDEPAALDS